VFVDEYMKLKIMLKERRLRGKKRASCLGSVTQSLIVLPSLSVSMIATGFMGFISLVFDRLRSCKYEKWRSVGYYSW